MMRCGENNHHVNDGYEKEMAPSSDVNDTDKDELKIHRARTFSQTFIGESIYGRKQIRMQHRKQNFITE